MLLHSNCLARQSRNKFRACGCRQVEDLEETLNDSVRDSIMGRKKVSEEVVAAKKAAAERRRRQREDEADAGAP